MQRVSPHVMLHKLPYEGHFTYFYFCDECHRQIFTVVYGNPEGPLVDPVPTKDDKEDRQLVFSDIGTDEVNVSR